MTPEFRIVVGCEQTTDYVNASIVTRVSSLLEAMLTGSIINGIVEMEHLTQMLDETQLVDQPCDYVGEVTAEREGSRIRWVCPACLKVNVILRDHLEADDVH